MDPSIVPCLAANAVHVWRFPLVAARQEISALACWLDDYERAFLRRRISGTEKDKRVIAWGRLRYVLSRYLGCSPEAVELIRPITGRPQIAGPSAAGMQFSLSHSGSFGLVALGYCGVGVDIEKMDPVARVERLAARFFTEGEARRLRALPDADRTAAFYRLWVHKEAYLKAIGAGVPSGLSRCEISLEPSRLLCTELEDEETHATLLEIPVSQGYVAAAALLCGPADVSAFDL